MLPADVIFNLAFVDKIDEDGKAAFVLDDEIIGVGKYLIYSAENDRKEGIFNIATKGRTKKYSLADGFNFAKTTIRLCEVDGKYVFKNDAEKIFGSIESIIADLEKEFKSEGFLEKGDRLSPIIMRFFAGLLNHYDPNKYQPVPSQVEQSLIGSPSYGPG